MCLFLMVSKIIYTAKMKGKKEQRISNFLCRKRIPRLYGEYEGLNSDIVITQALCDLVFGLPFQAIERKLTLLYLETTNF